MYLRRIHSISCFTSHSLGFASFCYVN